MKKFLNVKEYVEGKCFICGKTEDMPKDAYCHYVCAVALLNDKEKRIREAQKEI